MHSMHERLSSLHSEMPMSTTTQREPTERTHDPTSSSVADCWEIPSTMSANPAENRTNDAAVSVCSLMDEGRLSAHTASATSVTTPTKDEASRASDRIPTYCGYSTAFVSQVPNSSAASATRQRTQVASMVCRASSTRFPFRCFRGPRASLPHFTPLRQGKTIVLVPRG